MCCVCLLCVCVVWCVCWVGGLKMFLLGLFVGCVCLLDLLGVVY